MRTKILQYLRASQEEYLSGEELCKQLAVSRTAIWKHMKILKQEGYEIEAHPRKGYRLHGVPDRLLPAEIYGRLKTHIIGKEIRYIPQTDSTNNEGKKIAGEGCREGTIILAEEQLGGRGRLARGWFSPAGKGIWLSVVLRPPFSPYDAPKCTLLAAVAVNQAIYRVTGVECKIKWPNDILYQGKKLVGILTEMSAEVDAINYVVIGMGINVNIEPEEFPEELREIATSLSQAAKKPVSRLELLAAVLEELETLYNEVKEKGFPGILAKWRTLSGTLGSPVRVLGSTRQFDGIAVDIDEDGALLVKTDEGTERVLAGDVSIRAKG